MCSLPYFLWVLFLLLSSRNFKTHQWQLIGGIPAITSAMVIIVGLFGAVLGYPIMKLFRVKHPLAKGLSIGTVSHALGTAKAVEENYQEGAFSSLALVICGIMTTLLAPLMFPLLLRIFGHA